MPTHCPLLSSPGLHVCQAGPPAGSPLGREGEEGEAHVGKTENKRQLAD